MPHSQVVHIQAAMGGIDTGDHAWYTFRRLCLVHISTINDNGQAILKWLRDPYSLGVYSSLEHLVAVHGHGGNTQVEFVESK